MSRPAGYRYRNPNRGGKLTLGSTLILECRPFNPPLPRSGNPHNEVSPSISYFEVAAWPPLIEFEEVFNPPKRLDFLLGQQMAQYPLTRYLQRA